MSSIKVGFIGLGNMGMLMVKKLVENKLPLTVYDLRKEAVEEIVALGAKGANSSREVAEVSDIIISVVRDIPQNDEVIFGKDGVWEGVRKGSTLVISSSINPSYVQELYTKAKEKGVRVIDAPVSAEARDFTPGKEWALLTLMVGGDEDAVKECWPVFEAIAKNVIHQGGIGTGMACKLVNNLAMYANNIVARECANLGLKAGLDLQKMAQAISVSTGYSRAFGGMGRRMGGPASGPRPPVARAPGAPEDLGSKDKRLALEMAEEVGANTPVVRFMEKLDLESLYDAYSDLMRR
jgi:3-hydroxyisobutyrate dehydrogenase-like beta-hydroxyacid dehydrogenase